MKNEHVLIFDFDFYFDSMLTTESYLDILNHINITLFSINPIYCIQLRVNLNNHTN